MSHQKCLHCNFYVTKEDEVCANCGVIKPLVPFEMEHADVPGNKPIGGLVLTICIAIILSLIIGASTEAGLGCLLLPCFVILGLFGYAFIAVYLENSERNRNMERQTLKGFRKNASLIENRLAEISERERQIKKVLSQAEKVQGGVALTDWRVVCDQLKDVLLTLQNQYARYCIKTVEIDVARWQNGLLPILENISVVNYEQSDANLRTIEETRAKGLAIQKRLEKYRTTLGDISDIKILNDIINETLESHDKLRQALIGRQAVLTLQALNDLEGSIKQLPQPSINTFRELEVFNSQVSITDFSSSFDELEAEYLRFKTGNELKRQIDEIIGKANS